MKRMLSLLTLILLFFNECKDDPKYTYITLDDFLLNASKKPVKFQPSSISTKGLNIILVFHSHMGVLF